MTQSTPKAAHSQIPKKQSKFFGLRMSEEEWNELDSMAKAIGMTASSFARDAISQYVRHFNSAMADRNSDWLDLVRASATTYLLEVRQGGELSYEKAGYSFVVHLGRATKEHTVPELEEKVARLLAQLDLAARFSFSRDQNNLNALNGDIVWKCFLHEFPDAATLIPSRRRWQFVDGLTCAWAEGVLARRNHPLPMTFPLKEGQMKSPGKGAPQNFPSNEQGDTAEVIPKKEEDEMR